jgi:hypothetical protein
MGAFGGDHFGRVQEGIKSLIGGMKFVVFAAFEEEMFVFFKEFM